MVIFIGQSIRLFAVLVVLSPALSSSTGLIKNLHHRIIAEKRFVSGVFKNRLDFQGPQLPAESVVGQQEDVVLYCQVSGSPSPTIHWLKHGERIQQGSSHDIRDDEARYEEIVSKDGISRTGVAMVRSSLFIDCVSGRDAGVYTCVADTPYQRITRSTTLVIEDMMEEAMEDQCLVKKALSGEPARIFMWTGTRIENQGSDVQLFCRSEGYPLPAVTWRDINGNIISNSQKYQIMKNGDLLIMNLTWDDNFGYHSCQVENNSGQDKKKVMVYPVKPAK